VWMNGFVNKFWSGECSYYLFSEIQLQNLYGKQFGTDA